jgi:hypothetical protein
MAGQQPKNEIELEFLNITNPVQRQDTAHQKKVRKNAISHYWQARKDLARSFTIPVHRQLRPFPTSPGCVCHGLGYIENGGSRKPCLQCGRDVSLRLHAEGNAPRWEANSSPGGKSTVAQVETVVEQMISQLWSWEILASSLGPAIEILSQVFPF